jgi:hypothetical protein
MAKKSEKIHIDLPSVAREEDLRTELEKVFNLRVGHVLGLSLKDDFKALTAKAGESAIAQFEKKTKELGYETDFTDINSYSWYPAGYEAVLCLVATHLFKWEPDDIVELGILSVRDSLLLKIIMRFVSMKDTLDKGARYWQKYYDFGEFVSTEYSEENSCASFQIKNYKVHPVINYFQAGYFHSITELATGSKEVVVEVVSPPHSKDDCIEYKVCW